MARLRWIGTACAALLLAGAVVALWSGPRSGDDTFATSASAERDVGGFGVDVPAAGPPGEGAAGSLEVSGYSSRGGGAAGGGSEIGGTVDPHVVRTAELDIEIEAGSFAAAYDKAMRVAATHGGFVTRSSTGHGDIGGLRERAPDDAPRHGVVTLRVPSGAFEPARADLAALGELRSDVSTGEDVGGQLVDLEARLRSLRAEEDALRAIMGRANTIGETLQVQQALTKVRSDIETIDGQRAHLADAAALATITATVREPGAAGRAATAPTGLASNVRTALDGALAVVGGTIVVLGYAIPLGVIALVAWAAGCAVRSGLRRRRGPSVATA